MQDPVHVLVAGWEAPTPTAAILRDARLGVFLDTLADRDVVVRPWSSVRLVVPPDSAADPGGAARRGALSVLGDELRWADVVLLRASDLATAACVACDRVAFGEEAARAHTIATGHSLRRAAAEPIRWLLQALEVNSGLLRSRALVFDVDDGLEALDGGDTLVAEPVARAIRIAVLAVAATDASAAAIRRLAPAARLIRCAVDRRWAAERREPPAGETGGSEPAETAETATPPALRLAAFGSLAAVGELVAGLGPVLAASPVVWLTSEHSRVDGLTAVAPPLAVDEISHALAQTGAEAALAPAMRQPVWGGELAWLLGALAGLPTVAARHAGGRVAYPIRDGIDGLLAAERSDWRKAVGRLAESPALRADLAAATRERARSDYDLADRGAEWADAFRWAAEHAGRAAARRLIPVAGPTRDAAVAQATAEAAATIAHSRRMRRRADEDRQTLERLRGGRDVCWPEDMGDEPLVSVVIPTYSRGRILVERSLASVLAQTYERLDVVVVGDHATPETVEAIGRVRDPRVRFLDLPERSPYRPEPFLRWLQVGSRPMNRAIELARGAFIAPNADDDEFTPDHVELLLSVALEYRLEFVYGDSMMELHDGSWHRVGDWPPHEGGICGGSVLYAAPLRFVAMDEDCWRDLEPNDWNQFRRMIEAGARAGHVPEIVFRHYREGREWHPPAEGVRARDLAQDGARGPARDRAGEPATGGGIGAAAGVARGGRDGT